MCPNPRKSRILLEGLLWNLDNCFNNLLHIVKLRIHSLRSYSIMFPGYFCISMTNKEVACTAVYLLKWTKSEDFIEMYKSKLRLLFEYSTAWNVVVMLYNRLQLWVQGSLVFGVLMTTWDVLRYMWSYGRKSRHSLELLLQTLHNFSNTILCKLKTRNHTVKSYRIRGLSWFLICKTNQEMKCIRLHVPVWTKIEDFTETSAAKPR